MYSSSSNIIVIKPMRIKWVKNVACMVEMRNAYKIVVRNSQEKMSLGRPKCKWEDNTKMCFKK